MDFRPSSRRALGAVLAGAICVLGAGCDPPPVTDQATLVSEYDGHPVAKAYAHTFGDRSILKAGIMGNYSDPKADGNGVYLSIDGAYYNDASGGTPWSSSWTAPTIGVADGEKTFSDVHSIFNAPGSVGYWVDVCAQMGFPIPDSCTGRSVRSVF